MMRASVLVILMLQISGEVYKTDLDGRTYSIGTFNANWNKTFTLPQQMPGWPKSIGTNPNYGPSGINLADINKDGDLEIIVGSMNNQVYVWDYQGNPLSGWPVTIRIFNLT